MQPSVKFILNTNEEYQLKVHFKKHLTQLKMTHFILL